MASSSSRDFQDVQETCIAKLWKQNDQDRATVRELRRLFNEFHIGTLTRDEVVRDLAKFPHTDAQYAGAVFLIDAGMKDVDVLRGIKVLYPDIEEAMLVKLKYLSSV
jgi:hypothetical protein